MEAGWICSIEVSTMSNIRPAAVAGMFYPAEPDRLHRMVCALLAEAAGKGVVPKALIAPHAGYIYSGPIAASAYKQVESARGRIRRVVLLGPAHRIGFNGLAASTADAFSTPLGNVRLDRESIAEILQLPYVIALDQAHAEEHSLEVHLPFLLETLGDFSLVPLVVGHSQAEQVEEVLDRLWGGEETLIVISSDLSHYHEYSAARAMDAATAQSIVDMVPERIGYEDACGRLPIAGLLLAAAHRGLHADLLDLRNSGDTAGPRDRVVGYGAYVFH